MKPSVDHKPARVNVISTKTSERQLSRIVNRRGGPFMSVVQAELARYIACCEQVGRELDTEGQALRYDDRISLLIRKQGGIWRILKVWEREGEEVFQPVFVWQVVKRGWRTFLASVLVGWCCQIRSGTQARKLAEACSI